MRPKFLATRFCIWIVLEVLTKSFHTPAMAFPAYCDLIPDAVNLNIGCSSSNGIVDSASPKTVDASLVDSDEPEPSYKFEGDILGIDPEASNLAGPNVQANGILDVNRQWPKGEIPYTLSPQFRERDVAIIMRAIDVFHKNTCVKFRLRRPTDKDYLRLSAAYSCSSYIGKLGDKQTVQLSISGCMSYGVVQHELMHAVGFYHEQSRTDRDDYVKINWPNIAEADKKEFQKYSDKEVTAFGESYDFNSVMHYNENEFGVRKEPGQWTIKPKPKWHFKGKLGQRDGLSETDIKKINFMYNCTQAGPCPTSKGWMNYEDKCYFLSFAADDSSRKTFVGARNFCRTQGATIAGPSSTVIKNFLVAQITRFPGVETDENVWISSCRVISVDNPWPSDDDCLTKSYFVCQRNAADVSASSVSQDES